MAYIIITGNPVDGFAYEGPYPSHDDAVAAAEDFGGDWWIATLHPPGTLAKFSPLESTINDKPWVKFKDMDELKRWYKAQLDDPDYKENMNDLQIPYSAKVR